MDSTVVNAIWCAIVVLTIATLTSTSFYKVKKPSKHNEPFGTKQEMSRDRTSVENQTLNQTPPIFRKMSQVLNIVLSKARIMNPFSEASITDTYSEKQFVKDLSKFIVELTNRCDSSEDQHTGDFSKYYPISVDQIFKVERIDDDQISKVKHIDDDQISKVERIDDVQTPKVEHIDNDQICKGKHMEDDQICKGKKYKFNDYELTAIYVHYTSHMFKTNFNGRDLVIRYLKYIPCCEDKIIVKAKHENIVEVYDSFYTDDKTGFFMVMEAMDCNLCQYSKKHPDKLKDVVKSVVNALQYLHGKGIAHCNLKLDNILVKTVGGKTVYKLCNFAAAMFIIGDEVIEPENFSYTASYQAPETFFSSKFTAKTDIWLLGHTIWYYIESDNKFYGTNGDFDDDKYKKYLESPEECPLRKNRLEIINKCCTIAPEERASFETILEWCNEEDDRKPCTKMCAKILDFFRLRSISNY